MPTEAQVKKIARSIARGEARDVAAEITALAQEEQLLNQLQSRQGAGEGWYVVSDGGKPRPMHRLEVMNPPLAALVRQQAQRLPLLCRIITYGQMEWWEARNIVHLSDEELDSAFIYRETYEKAVAAGDAPARPIQETDPGEEPSGGELYRIAKALYAGLDRFGVRDPLKRIAGILYTSIKNGGTPSEVLGRTFREQTSEQIMAALAGIVQVVPEVGRLVAWLEHGEAA